MAFLQSIGVPGNWQGLHGRNKKQRSLDTGLTTIKVIAPRAFLAGVRSRAAAAELTAVGIALGESISEVSRNLRSEEIVARLRPLVSPPTGEWLGLLVEAESRRRPQSIPEPPAFTLDGDEGLDFLHVRKIGTQVFLTTVDGAVRFAIAGADTLPFEKVANDPRLAFARVADRWEPVLRDPRARMRRGDEVAP